MNKDKSIMGNNGYLDRYITSPSSFKKGWVKYNNGIQQVITTPFTIQFNRTGNPITEHSK